MDLDTSAFVAEVNSSSLLKSKLDRNVNFLESDSISYQSTNAKVFEDENDYLEPDYLIASPDISSNNNICDSSNSQPDSTVELTTDLNFSTARLNDIENQSEYFADSTLEVNPYCITNECSSVDDIVVNKDYGQIPLNTGDVCSDNDVSKYQDVSSTPSELINPESILEANSQLLDEQDKADFAALELDDYLTLTKDIGPHFIVGSFSNYNENLKHSLDENHIDSGDMGIENTWNEEFAVPSTSNFPLPLPAPPENSNFNDFSSCNNFDSVEPDSYASDLEALFSTNEADTDVTDPAAVEGVCGLRNLGNTCFMSTGVQCLAATKFLVHYFIKKLSIQELDESSLTMQFAKLLQKMWSGQYSVVHPTKFKQALGVYYPQFKDCSQHDCQEFLALLLDALHQQLVSLPKKPFEDESVFEFKENMDIGVDYLSSVDLHTKNELNEFMNNNEESEVSVDCITSTNAENVDDNHMEVFVNSFSPKNDVEEATSSTSTAENDDETEVTGNKLNYIEDILKEAKTSNVNVLVTETEANNEICFDSEKFPKKERRRNIAETNYYDIYANVTNAIQKNSSSYFDSEPNFGDNLDLKRIKVNHLSKEKNCLMEKENYSGKSIEKNVRIENERKMKVLNVDMNSGKEEDVMETEEEREVVMEEVEMRTDDGSEEIVSQTSEEDVSADNLEAEKHWEKHIKNNKSVIFDSFQGQFKNTVVCSVCDFKSITYEPFMYLSVPLPHAIEKQICVTFISANANPPVQYLVTLTKQDEVSKIKQQLMKLITDKLKYPVVIGEVLDYHIAKILDDNHQIRYLDDVNRSIYAFEQLCLMPKNKSESDSSSNILSSSKEILNSVSETCTICLEEKESDIKRHRNCACILCDVCIQMYAQHQGEKTIKCPVCRTDLIPDKDLVPIEQTDMKPSMRLLNVPLVYRVDKTGDGNNNQKTVMLFGHPALLKLPNQISGAELYDVVSSLHPYKESFKLLLVDGQGRHCSRCMFNQHCRGCVISPDSHISLRTDDTLAVTFAESMNEVHEIRHSSMTFQRTHKTLSLYDCVEAFSQSEILDEFNPWYCPRCEKNQCATKTLSVWRFPNYLIVYLKRFVFHECTSIKLEDKVMFPLHDFNLNKKSESSYDLYACVCHTGGVSVGHYIAYTQHPVSHEWHCFNDENVSKQKPQEEEYCNAYILFYKKRNTKAEDEVE